MGCYLNAQRLIYLHWIKLIASNFNPLQACTSLIILSLWVGYHAANRRVAGN